MNESSLVVLETSIFRFVRSELLPSRVLLEGCQNKLFHTFLNCIGRIPVSMNPVQKYLRYLYKYLLPSLNLHWETVKEQDLINITYTQYNTLLLTISETVRLKLVLMGTEELTNNFV